MERFIQSGIRPGEGVLKRTKHHRWTSGSLQLWLKVFHIGLWRQTVVRCHELLCSSFQFLLGTTHQPQIKPDNYSFVPSTTPTPTMSSLLYRIKPKPHLLPRSLTLNLLFSLAIRLRKTIWTPDHAQALIWWLKEENIMTTPKSSHAYFPPLWKTRTKISLKLVMTSCTCDSKILRKSGVESLHQYNHNHQTWHSTYF